MPRRREVLAGQTLTLGTFEIPGFTGLRRVRVHLPGSLRVHPELRRPTLVLFDGQNVFDDDGSFVGGWHAHGAVDRFATGRSIAPVIAAIDHGGEHRITELTPFHDGKRGGGTDQLVAWIVKGLLPELHKRFPLQSGPSGHIVGGSSLGGLAALYAHFHRPDVFAGALCMSPSFWFHKGAIFDFVKSQTNPFQSRVYIDCGAREGRMLPLAAKMTDHLSARGWKEQGPLRLMWRPDSRGTHSEAHWRRRLPKALRFMFGNS